jgi:peptidoglycan/LPS O-acetylase OafA/YrhL
MAAATPLPQRADPAMPPRRSAFRLSLPSPLSSGSRIPSLDGLRALSIAFVCLGHASGTVNFPASPIRFWVLGHLGVRVFFVISGLLITGILMREHASGGIRLGRFYLRRTLRIFPPAYAYLAFLTLAAALSWVSVPGHDLIRAATYTTIYGAREPVWQVSHTWSLSVEEQFYLLWPGLLALIGLRWGLRAALGIVLATSLLSYLAYYRHLVPEAIPDNLLYFRTVLVGCLLALTRERLWRWGWYRRLLHPLPVALMAIGVLGAAFANMEHQMPRAMRVAGLLGMDLAIALCLDYCVRNPQGLAGRVLNWKPLIVVGVMSYSIYLWQNLFLNRYETAFVNTFPYNLVLVAVAATASFYLVERPSFALRERLERRRRRADAPRKRAAAIA